MSVTTKGTVKMAGPQYAFLTSESGGDTYCHISVIEQAGLALSKRGHRRLRSRVTSSRTACDLDRARRLNQPIPNPINRKISNVWKKR
jgi:hypothetical protein